ncbi:MAG: M20/M25/M40 family metallo-hydrolase [Clostridia bacterium]|nr:M20/M25/M40 family metallo-hydrolase [Clostridia bacterium]
MSKLQKLIDKKAQSADFMAQEIAHICNDMPKRDPGSLGEKMACEYMADYVKNECGCERVDVEEFEEHPNAFFGWIYFTVTFILAGMLLFFFVPLAATLLGVLGFTIMFIQFGFYKKLVDKFFPKKIGHNMTAIKKCSGEVRGRVFFNGHADAVWNWPVNDRFGGKVHMAHLISSILGALISLGLNLAATIVLATKGEFVVNSFVFGNMLALYSPALLYLGFAVMVFVPGLIGMYFMWDEHTIVDGANDNLTGCYIGIAILKALKDEGIELEHTEVGVIVSGSEEAGLRGAMAWAKAHENDFKDVPTWIYSYDTIHEARFLGVNYRDLNGTVPSDKEVSDSFIEAAKELDIQCSKTWVPPLGGGTDNAAFLQRGFKSTGITALDHNLQPYYHTMKDNADNLDKGCLADCYAVSVKCLENFDAQVSNK